MKGFREVPEYLGFYRCLMAVIFGAFSVGQASSFVPDYATAQIAASRLFRLFDRTPPIDSYDESGEKPVSSLDSTR